MSGESLGFIKALLFQGRDPLEVLETVKQSFPLESPSDLEKLVESEVERLNGNRVKVQSELTYAETQLLEKVKTYINNQLAANKPFGTIKDDVYSLWAPNVAEIAIAQVEKHLAETYVWPDGGIAKDTGKPQWYPGPDINSKFWLTLRKNLESSNLSEGAVADLDGMSTKIVACLPPPNSETFSGRGLVLGYVQSGKTTSFMAVISKAVDAGYRFVIVLSGTTNNLRAQTQSRLEQQLTANQHNWHWLTGIDKDFSAFNNANNLLQPSETRIIAVVKKNKAVLKRLYAWLDSANALTRGKLPVLIIDDESDQASVNTARQQNARTAINKALHDLLDTSFLRKIAYVGYSATPFANLLVDTTDADSIYPRDFVVSLPLNPDYFGPERLFGSALLADEGDSETWDVIRDIPNSDVDLVKPPKKRTITWKPTLTESLKDSVRWFLIATAVRRIREHDLAWSSMMIHTSPNVQPHEDMKKIIEELLNSWSQDRSLLKQESLLQLTSEVGRSSEFIEPDLSEMLADRSAEFFEALEGTLQDTKVLVDNYASLDRLDYSLDPFPVIVVGGNTLSRGLTLEGLVSTFFLRTSSAYDSLLQMGRWFGYRKGYEDLQRIWLANEAPYSLKTWFGKLAFVEQEIRDQIEVLTISGISPSELGVRIRQLPGMSITAAAKMRSAVKAELSYSGTQPQTILFSEDPEIQKENFELLKTFVESIDHELKKNDSGFAAISMDSATVMDFVRAYQFPDASLVLQSDRISSYVQKLNDDGELLTWNVAIYSNAKKNAPTKQLSSLIKVGMANRSKLKTENEIIDIKTLISVGDLVADVPSLRAAARGDKGTLRKSDLLAQRMLHEDTKARGLLGIYVIDPKSKVSLKESTEREKLDLETPLVGLFFVFPESTNPNAAVFVTPNLQDQAELEDLDEEAQITVLEGDEEKEDAK
jgi:hypothetical protein